MNLVQRETYKLEAIAQDRGFPSLSRTVEVQIDVVDRANNPPVWDRQIYGPIHVKENIAVGAKVLSVKARSVLNALHSTPVNFLPLFVSLPFTENVWFAGIFLWFEFLCKTEGQLCRWVSVFWKFWFLRFLIHYSLVYSQWSTVFQWLWSCMKLNVEIGLALSPKKHFNFQGFVHLWN